MPGKGKPFTPGDPRAGRPKGVANKFTEGAKKAFELAFEGLGGVKDLVEWAKDNRTEFYKLYARLIPTDVNLRGKDGEALPGVIQLPAKEVVGQVGTNTEAERIPRLDS